MLIEKPPSTDVLIVGASLAGATLAALLSDAGFTVQLVDRATFPRKKVCGEGLMPAGVQILEGLGLAGALARKEAVPFEGIRLHAPWRESITLRFEDSRAGARGMVLKREHLDQMLVEFAARKPLVEVRQGYRIRNLKISKDSVSVEGDFRRGDGSLTSDRRRARLIVGADGIRSFVRARVKIPLRAARFTRHAIRGLFTALPPRGAKLVDVFCKADSEAYVAPMGTSTARVTVLCSSGHGAGQGRSLTERLLDFPELQERIGACEPIRLDATNPVSIRARHYHSRRCVLIGDAAGAVDPITGQGMTIALRDALLAARLIADCLLEDRLSAPDLGHFTTERNTYFLPAFRLAEELLIAMRFPRIGKRVLRTLRRSPSLRTKLLSSAVHQHPVPVSGWDRLQMVAGF